jgi:hypothetical protein
MMRNFQKKPEINLNVEWDEVSSGHSSKGFEKTVCISTTKSKRDLVINDRLSIKIGAEVSDKLGWAKGDSICMYTHPDNAYLVKLVKSTGGNGWTLGQNKFDRYVTLTLTWRNPQNMTLEGVANGEVKWQIMKDALIFNIYD